MLESLIFKYNWETDFPKRSVPFDEIQFLRLPRIPIRSSDVNTNESIGEANKRVSELEPVIVVEINGEARAYPKSLLIFLADEVVNDVLGGVPIAVTWCPLCNVAVVVGRNINGKTFSFGVSGLLRKSNLLMWDKETESWWQQGTAEAIVGTMTGTKLETFPTQIVAFRDFKADFPQGTVLKGPRVEKPPLLTQVTTRLGIPTCSGRRSISAFQLWSGLSASRLGVKSAPTHSKN